MVLEMLMYPHTWNNENQGVGLLENATKKLKYRIRIFHFHLYTFMLVSNFVKLELFVCKLEVNIIFLLLTISLDYSNVIGTYYCRISSVESTL